MMNFPKEQSRSELAKIKMKISSHWPKLAKDDRQTTLTFPGPMPVSLGMTNLPKLREYPYVVSQKTDGLRFLLLSYRGVTYLASRSYDFYKVDKQLFKVSSEADRLDYLVDGELMISDNKYTYIIHDIITSALVSSYNIADNFFDQRYNAAKDLMLMYIPNDTINVELKKFYNTKDIKLLISNQCYKADGYIFTPKKKPIGTHTQYNLFKWKMYHTFDFRMFKTKTDEYEFFAIGKDGISETCYARITLDDDENSKLFTESLILNCPDFVNGDVIEFTTNTAANYYFPKIVRKDKEYPNSLKNILRTIDDVKNNVPLEHLISYLSE
jgi:hypothetical protein